MVLGYHLIFNAYGWWLPNDPRGSMSKQIHSDVIADLGALHYGRKRIQPSSSTIRKFYTEAENALLYPLLAFEPIDREWLAVAFAEVIQRQKYCCYALAIMQDHIHACIRKHRDTAEQMIEKLQAASEELLNKNIVVPPLTPSGVAQAAKYSSTPQTTSAARSNTSTTTPSKRIGPRNISIS